MKPEIVVPCIPQEERGPALPAQIGPNVREPQYGRYLADFLEGEVFEHPRGITLTPAFCQDFAATFMETNPIYLNDEFARTHGFERRPASPLLTLNLALSLGVQNDSEKAIAHLGYYNVLFLRPAYPGDTIRSLTKVLKRQERGEGKPGIVSVRTIGLNQREEVVVQYDRKIMIPAGGSRDTRPSGAAFLAAREGASTACLPRLGAGTAPSLAGSAVGSGRKAVRFPEEGKASIHLPKPNGAYPANLTGPNTYFEDFAVGEIIVHANGRTITDEHYGWTYKLGNTHPLHYDKLYSAGRGGPLSGEPVVYGGLVFAWLAGLASRDTEENALWDFGYTEGYHTQPSVSGDTVSALSRVLHKEDGPPGLHAGVVTFQLIGVKGLKAKDALAKYGPDLFLKENDKKDKGKEKISEKIFEIERRLLIKKRPT
ncbi:MAG: MaoC family dehydratase N-terminal domain-containing protein [Nitrospirae bacterium]|nr:MaoC family dehydratase N-terminal domain-containing protein [Nitrospirota bacterium]